MEQNEKMEKAIQSVTNIMRERGFKVELKSVARPKTPAVTVIIEISKKEMKQMFSGIVKKSIRIEKAE